MRRKFEIKKIESIKKQAVTFCRRRKGLLKKAKELAILCDAEVAVIIFSHKGKPYTFASSSMEEILAKYNKTSQCSSLVSTENATDLVLLEEPQNLTMQLSKFGGAEGREEVEEDGSRGAKRRLIIEDLEESEEAPLDTIKREEIRRGKRKVGEGAQKEFNDIDIGERQGKTNILISPAFLEAITNLYNVVSNLEIRLESHEAFIQERFDALEKKIEDFEAKLPKKVEENGCIDDKYDNNDRGDDKNDNGRIDDKNDNDDDDDDDDGNYDNNDGRNKDGEKYLFAH